MKAERVHRAISRMVGGLTEESSSSTVESQLQEVAFTMMTAPPACQYALGVDNDGAVPGADSNPVQLSMPNSLLFG